MSQWEARIQGNRVNKVLVTVLILAAITLRSVPSRAGGEVGLPATFLPPYDEGLLCPNGVSDHVSFVLWTLTGGCVPSNSARDGDLFSSRSKLFWDRPLVHMDERIWSAAGVTFRLAEGTQTSTWIATADVWLPEGGGYCMTLVEFTGSSVTDSDTSCTEFPAHLFVDLVMTPGPLYSARVWYDRTMLRNFQKVPPRHAYVRSISIVGSCDSSTCP